jgi:demethylmenaquinone methyltransferase/2-methoxy-6-polyprenyl-1,4-benzoquinol methylase
MESREPRRIRQMFDGVARRYDLLNHLLSANLDRRWRRRAVAEVGPDGDALVLDLCGGTGDLSLALARSGSAKRVICCDFSHEMLTLAADKFRRSGVDGRCVVLEGDALRLPFANRSFDAVTVAFGVRNFADMDAGFREIRRVLAPAGRLVVLEFSKPTAPLLKQLYNFYLGRVLPRLGDRVSGHSGPYGYLARTISEFPDPARLAGRIREAGFAACGWQTLSGGIVAIHTAFNHHS